MNTATQAIKDATLEMRDYAKFSILLGAISTLCLFVTIGFTWRAVYDTRNIGQKQVRAYVSLKDCRIDGIMIGSKPTAYLNFTNAGQTPCIVKATSIGIDLVEWPIKDIPTLSPVPKSAPSSEGGGAEFSHNISASKAIGPSELAAYQNGRMAFVVICTILYDDIFGSAHEETVCVYRTFDKPRGDNGLAVLSFGNKSS